MERGDSTMKTQANYLGNSLKNLHISIDNSLKLLHTDYIDILYVHYWDLHTSVEEIMDGLHQLVLSGKVLYLVNSFFSDRPRATPNTPRFLIALGHIGCTGLVCNASERLRQVHWKDTICGLPSRLLRCRT